MSSKIALHESSDSNCKTTDTSSKHRRALQVLQNQQKSTRPNQIKKQKHISEKQANENQASFASRIEALKNFQMKISNDMSNSSDDFDDEDFRNIMEKFEHFNDSEESMNMLKPTPADMDEIFVRNTAEAKEGSNKRFPYDQSENDPEFGRVV